MDDITSSLLRFEEEQYRAKVEGPVFDFLTTLEEMVATLRQALLFMLVKVITRGLGNPHRMGASYGNSCPMTIGQET